MNAPVTVRLAGEADARALSAFVTADPQASAFHTSAWQTAVSRACGHEALALIAQRDGQIVATLPFHVVHSPLFGRALVSTGFAVGGGMLGDIDAAPQLFAAARELAARHNAPTIELRGGPLPVAADGWHIKTDSHAGFVAQLAADDEAQLLAVPRKQRAEVRKGLANRLAVRVGRDAEDRAMHYAVYAESVRNLGTPVFPRALFDAMLEGFGENADILTVLHDGTPVASVLSLYHRGAVLPYWGGGTYAARGLRANDVMYYALMNHARRRGCDRFDFGRSKVDTGAYHFKRNWGFVPAPLAYAHWTADGIAPRDINPLSPRYRARIAAWQRLPLGIANRLGPWIARGLG